MSVRSELVRGAVNSVNSAVSSAVGAAQSYIDQQNIKDRNDQIFKANQFKIQTSYQQGATEMLQGLPESTDFETYQQKVQEFNDAWVNQLVDSGVYDEQTMAWVQNEFIPSQKAATEKAVEGVKDYAQSTWLSNEASNYASVLAADTSLDVEEAYRNYEEFYNKCGLSNVPYGYGIMDPDTFKETIRGTKASQIFSSISRDREKGYLFNSDFSFNDAVEKAKEEAGYKPDAVGDQKFYSDCLSEIGQIEKDIENEVDAVCKSLEGQYNEFLMSDGSDMVNFDVESIREVASSYPSKFIGGFVTLMAKANDHNTKANIKVADALVNQGVFNDNVLALYDMAGTSEAKSRKQEVVSSKALEVAKAKGDGTPSGVLSYILTGDLGITVDPSTRYEIASDFVKEIKEGYETFKTYDEFAASMNEESMAGSPVSELLSALWTPQVTYTESSSDGMAKVVTKDIDFSLPLSVGEFGPDATISFKPKEENPILMADAPVFGGDDPLLQVVGNTAGDMETPEGPTYSGGFAFTAQGANSMTESNATEEETRINSQVAVDDFLALKAQGLPQAILDSVARKYFEDGALTEEWINDNVKQNSWVDNKNWNSLNSYIGNVLETSQFSLTSTQKDTISGKVYDRVLEAFRSSGMQWKDFEADLGKLVTVFASEETLGEKLGEMEKFNKVADKPDSFLKTLASQSYGDLIQGYFNGDYNAFLDYDIIDGIANAGGISEISNIGDMRDYVAAKMNLGSYEDAVAADPTGIYRYIIESNCAVAMLYNEAGEYYRKVASELTEEGVPTTLSHIMLDKEKGFVFIDNNTAKEGCALCVDPYTLAYNKDEGMSSKWEVVPVTRDSNGNYRLDKGAYSFYLGSFSGAGPIVSTTTKDKPDEKWYEKQKQAEADTYGTVYGGGGSNATADLLSGILGWMKTKRYEKQKESEKTFLDSYRNLCGFYED